LTQFIEKLNKWKITGVLLFLIPLVIGLIIAALIPRPVVGVITLDDAISSSTAQAMINQIGYARAHPEIRAVVLVLNSPGGTVTDTEAVYLELSRLRETKPVVTMIGSMAASGAYYLTVGTDYVFAEPSSMVGNVGVIGYTPQYPIVVDDIYSTGPYKLWGEPRDQFMREIEMLKQGFIQAVVLGRGEALKVDKEVILRGQIWTGADALRMGLIDELGSQSQAMDKAAQMAHIAHYRVMDLGTLAWGVDTSTEPEFFQKTSDGVITPYPAKQGLYMLYIPTTGEAQ
jgi:protease-4